MKATEILEREHRTIAGVAGVCGALSEELQKGAKVSPKILKSVVNFLEIYEHQYHHQEEKCLFDLLIKKGIPDGSCPIAVLSYEDEKLIALIEQLAAATDVYIKSQGAVAGTLIETLRALAEIYPDHIWKEDYLLLPMADKVFTSSDQEILAQNLQAIDSRKGREARKTVELLAAAVKTFPKGDPYRQHSDVA